MDKNELIQSIAMENPTAKYAFTKRRGVEFEYGDHWFDKYNIFDKPHGKKLFEIKNEYGNFAIDDDWIDVLDPLYGRCAMAIRIMDKHISEQEQAFDNLLYNHNHEFVVKHNQSGVHSFAGDGVYRVWLNNKLQFIVNEQDNNTIYLNRPKTIKCHPFDIIITTQALINLINRQK